MKTLGCSLVSSGIRRYRDTLEKVEELTLYLLELKWENEELRQKVEQYMSQSQHGLPLATI